MKVLRKISVLLVLLIALAVFTVITADAAEYTGKITASGVNVRAGAGTNYKVVANLAKSTKVTVIKNKLYSKNWYHIKLKTGTKGYVHKDYIKVSKSKAVLYINPKPTVYAGYKATYKSLKNTTGYTPKWSSSDKTVATINSKGVVKALKKGTTTITVKAGSLKCTSLLTVKNATVKMPQNSYEMFSDDTLTITPACKKKVSFTSSDENIATISSDGVLTPKTVGEVKITAASKSGSASCTVNIKKRVITLTADRKTLYDGCYAQLTASGGKYAYTYKSSDTSVLTVDNKGLVYTLKAGTAKVTCTSGDLTKSVKFTVKSGKTVKISDTNAEVKKGMTYYVKPSTSGVTWTSSNTDVATVEGGFVYAAAKGTAIIRASTSDGETDCLITVTAADPIRFVYTSENSANLGDTVTFYAITDTSRGDVEFKVTDPEGKTVWLKSPTKTETDGRYIWSKSRKLSTAGVYTIAAYSHTKTATSWTTCLNGSATTFVSSVASTGDYAFTERRVTTKQINNIASYEGFLSEVTPDPLVTDAPTVGYGRVIYANTAFYNNMTKDEAYAFLVKTVNDSGFTTNVNKILLDNKIKFNQCQFDALVDFSYNLGAYAIQNHEELIGALQNSYGKEANATKGYVKKTEVYARKTASDSGTKLKYLSPGTTVNLVDTKLYEDSWYKIKVGDDEGYIRKNQVAMLTTKETVRNLRNVDFKTFSKAVLSYHHASGTCYMGLLYRRLDEVELFYFNDYVKDGKENKYDLSYTCSTNSKTKLPQ